MSREITPSAQAALARLVELAGPGEIPEPPTVQERLDRLVEWYEAAEKPKKAGRKP